MEGWKDERIEGRKVRSREYIRKEERMGESMKEKLKDGMRK